MKLTRISIAVVLLAVDCLPFEAVAETYKWVQYGATGPEVRAITDGPTCPTARLDGVETPMAVRASPNSDFPIQVCAAHLPPAVQSITIDGYPLKPPPRELSRIVVIGDTGCRMKKEVMQACNDPVAWPFRQIADQAAYLKPDLVIHVGDYDYRETPCPPGNLGCAGSRSGDIWPVWRAEFFNPAEALLQSAPWVFVRGNHEECARGGKGWTRTIEPYPFDAAEPCAAARPPYLASLPGLSLAILDASMASESSVSEPQLATFRGQFEALSAQLKGPSWLLLHRPIWGVAEVKNGVALGSNLTLAAAADVLPRQIALMLSGHIHAFQIANYEGGRPPQIVAGHGGDNLDLEIPGDLTGVTINSVRIKQGVSFPAAFGFMSLDRRGDAWTATDYDVHGHAVRICQVDKNGVACP